MLKLNLLSYQLRELVEIAAMTEEITKDTNQPILGGFGVQMKEAESVGAQCVLDIADDFSAKLIGVFYGGFLDCYWALYTTDEDGGYFFKKFEDLEVCENCGFLFERDSMYKTEEGGYICEDCTDDYCLCENCGKYAVDVEKVIGLTTDYYYCPTCIGHLDNVSQCDDCGNYFLDDECGEVDEHGHAICGDCWSEGRWYLCEECGEIVYEDDAVFKNGYVYCEDCAPYFEYMDSDEISFYDTRKDRRLCSFGVEIESGTDEYEPFTDLSYFYPTDDSSIRGYYTPVEWVSDIFSIKELLSGVIASELTDIENNFKANSSCGLHVHAGEEFFKPLSKEKIRLWIHNNYNDLCKFARRSEEKAEEWAQDAVGAYYNQGNTLAEKLSFNGYNRYEALNLTNYATVELRIFSGSTNKQFIQAAVCFYDALIKFANTHNFIEVNKATIFDIIKSYDIKEGKEILLAYYYRIM